MTLGEMVITATRVTEDSRTIPANMTVITSEQIVEAGYGSVVEALEKRAGIHFRTSSTDSEAEIDLRGFGENSHGRVLVLLNGRKLNRPDMRSINWLQVPIGRIERIEVLRGPATTLYGDHAVGGVVNIITHKGNEKTACSLAAVAGSHGLSRQALTASGQNGSLSYAASLSNKSENGYRDRSVNRAQGGDLSLTYDLNPDFSADLAISALASEYEMPGGLTKTQYDADPRQAINQEDDVEDEYLNITGGLSYQVATDSSFRIEAGYNAKDIKMNMASWGTFQNLNISTFSLAPKYVYDRPLAGHTNRLTLGIDLTRDELDLERFNDKDRNIKVGSADISKTSMAPYIHDSLYLRDNLILSLGARAEKATYDGEETDGAGTNLTDDSLTHRKRAYHAGLTFLPAEKTKIFVKTERIFRLPFVDEQIQYQGLGSGFHRDLEPEKGMVYELGIEQHVSRDVHLSLTVFHMDMEDEIAWDWGKGANVNLGETVHRGMELAGNYDLADSLSLFTSYTLLRAEFADGPNDGNEIPMVPKHKVAAGAEAHITERLRLTGNVTYTSTMRRGGDNTNTAEMMDSYVLVDLTLRYAVELDNCAIETFAGIDNLLNREYVTYNYWGGLYPMPERTWKGGLTVNF